MPRLVRQRVPEVTPPPHETGEPKSLVASAARVKISNAGWTNFRFGDDSWQQEAWRFYDIIGELRFAANWIGSCCSRVRLYMAEVDKNGRIQQETKDPKVAAIADNLFGGPASKAEALRMLGVNLTVAGDAYVIGRSKKDSEDDEWFVCSNSEIRRLGRGAGTYYGFVNAEGKFLGGDDNKLDPNSDIIIRIWTPHPRRNLWADSPTRGALPMLWEIEKLTKFVFAQINSRLVSAGVLWIPKETSFPDLEGDSANGAEALTDHFVRVASMELKGEGTAAAMVPMVAEAPADALGKIQLTQFVSELSQQARELREEALARFATAMDMPPEILKGTGDTNHWSSWHVEESAVKVHIEPLVSRVCEGLNEGYVKSALEAIKKDPNRFILWYDTTPLTVRPQKLQDTQNLYKDRIVSRQAVLDAGDYKETDAPSEDEDNRRFFEEVVLRDTNQLNSPSVRKILGLPDDFQMAPAQQGQGPPPPPAPPTGIEPTSPPAIPQGSTAEGAPTEVQNNSTTPPPTGVTASSSVPSWANLAVASNAAVLRAMELAGKRLLGPADRGRHTDVPAHELHTKIKVRDEDHARKILVGAWDHLPFLYSMLDLWVNVDTLQGTLEQYCIQLLVSGTPHQMQLLGERLRERRLVYVS